MNEETIDPHAVDDGVVATAVAGAPVPGQPTDKGYNVTDDGNVATIGDKRYVREEALHGERQRAQTYAKTLQQLEPLMPEFEEFLAQKKAGRNATVDRATRSAPSQGDYNADELEGYAITRGYYTQDNKPDVKRAKDDLDIMTAIADRRAGRAVDPIRQAVGNDRAKDNYSAALGARFVDGEPIADERFIRAAFDSIPDNMKADPQIANVMQVVAAGLQALDQRRPENRGKQRGREPMFREGGGGARFGGDAGDSLDALDRAAARARGKTPDQWAKMTKAVSGGAFGGTVLDEV